MKTRFESGGAKCVATTLKSIRIAIALSFGIGTSVPLGLMAQTNCASTPPSLVSWWRGEGSGVDSAGSNNIITTNAVSFASGEVGSAFVFDGSTTYMAAAASPSLDVGVGSGLTFEYWINPADVSRTQIILEWNNGAGGIGVHLFHSDAGIGGLGALAADIVSTSGADQVLASAAGLVTAGTFQHIAVTYDKATGIGKLFYNGAAVASQNMGVFTAQTSYPLYFGTRVSGPAAVGSYYSGLMDEVSIYNRALADSEILAIFNAGSAGKCTAGVAPTIVTQPPTNVTVNAGATVNFAVSASGTAPLSYQWSFNGSNILAATSSSLVLSNVQVAQSGNYSLRVTNAFGSAASSNALVTVNSVSTNCIPAPSGLVSWWRGEGNGTDSAGSNNIVTNNAASFVLGGGGSAFDFDGLTSYLVAAPGPSLDVGVGSGLTFEYWINPADVSRTQIMLEWNSGAGAIGVSMFHSDPGVGGLGSLGANIVGTSGGGHVLASAAGRLTAGSFQHVALTYDKATGIGKLFYNGAAVASQNFGVFTPLTSYPLYFGKRVSGPAAVGSYYSGLLDEVSIYNRALADSEILAIFNAGSAGKCVPTTPTNCVPPPAGLVSWWAAEGNAADSADSNSGVLLNGAGFTNGIVGQAFNFNGSGAHVRIADRATLHSTNGLTVEAWISPSAIGAPQSIIGKWDNFLGLNQKTFSFALETDGRCYLAVSGSGTDSVTGQADSSNSIPVGQWSHVVGTYDGSSVRLYVNGLLQGQRAYNQGIFPGTNDLGIGGVVGGSAIGGVTAPFAGLIDEATLYSRALSASEVQAIYIAGSAGKCRSGGVAPSIIGRPPSVTANAGATVNFSVIASGTPPLSYQWRFNGSNILAATTTSLVLSNVQVSQSGNYSVRVTNAFGSALSSNALLTVNPVSTNCIPAPAGLVSSWRGEGDATDSVDSNSGTLFNGAGFASGEVGQAFNLDGVNDFIRVADAPNLRFTNAMTVEAWIFPTSLDSGAHEIVSKWDSPAAVDRSFTFTYRSSFLSFGLSADGGDSVSAAAFSSNGPPANQWSHVAGTYDGAAITVYINGSLQGSTSFTNGIFPGHADLSIGSALISGVFFNGKIDEPSVYNRALSLAEIQAVYNAGSAGKCRTETGVAPTIVTQPHSVAVNAGGTVNFAVSASGTAPLSYQWRFNGSNILAATGTSLVLSNVQVSESGNYAVLVTNAFGSAPSSNAVLTVNSVSTNCVPTPSGLVSWWAAEGDAHDSVDSNSGTLLSGLGFGAGEVGQAFSFNGSNAYVAFPASSSLDVGLGSGLTIECWIRPADLTTGHAVAEWNNGAGGLGVHLWISIPDYGGPGSIFANLVDTNGGYHFFASAANVLNTTNFQHVALTYDKTTNGTATIFLNGVPVATQNFGSFTPRTSYGFYLGNRISGPRAGSVYNGLMDEVSLYGRALSQTEIQAIYNAGSPGKCRTGARVPPTILTQPQSLAVNVGATVNFSVTASGTAPLSYQWSFNGSNILAATGTSLMLSNVQVSQSGNYAVVVTNAFGSAPSSNAVLTINPVSTNCVPTPSGLVSWWAAEGNGNDIVGSNAGILANGVSFAAGEVGQAFSFDGSSNYVKIPASESLNVGSSTGLTIECWIKPNELSIARPLVEYNNGTNIGVQLWISEPWFEGQGGPGDLFANVTDSDGGTRALVSVPGVLNTNRFQHVAVTYDKASGLGVLYVNGAVVYSHDLGSFTPLTSYDMFLGLRPAASPYSSIYSGLMDETSLYERALSQAEIQAIYNAGSAGKCRTGAGVPPTIVTQPHSLAVNVGATVNFAVGASGTAPLSYQWSFNGSNILAAAGTSLLLSNVQVSQSGNYAVRVTNAFGSAPSSNALLTVNPVSTNCVPPPAGLVSWWAAEGNANDIVDSNPGSLSNGVSFVAGEVGQAFSLNGTGFVRVAASSNLNVGTGNGLTVECWIKPSDLAVARPVVEWNNGSIYGVHMWINEPWFEGQGGPGDLFANISDTSGGVNALVSAPGVLNTNSFQHVALTYDKASGLGVLYVNGAVVYSHNLGTFTPQTSYDLYFGLRPSPQYPSIYTGLMDEVSVYARALSQSEIQGIYIAGSAGKCRTAVAPFIISQPTSRTIAAGSSTTFNVVAGGTPPLNYQWRFNGTNIAGATLSSLTISNAQLVNAGVYSVVVSNLADSVPSSNVLLTVTIPTSIVQVPNVTNAPAGGTITIPVLLKANGNENALSFSLNFSTSRLAYVSVALGSGAGSATLFVNESQAANGRLGIALALPTDVTFSPGTQELINVTFSVGVVTNSTSTTISLTDQPIVRQLADTLGNILPAVYLSGIITIPSVEFEADVSPRPNGSKAVTVADWVLIGRFAAGLDSPTNASEFQRADCAPRASLGNGHITVTDWVQAGRYVAGLDPLTPAGGPISPQALKTHRILGSSGPSGDNLSRQLRVSDTTLTAGQTGTISVSLQGQGDENALGFSLTFDPSLTFVGASLANGSSGATLNVNASQISSGRLGFVLALSSGKKFSVGANELVKVSFRAAPSAVGSCVVGFADNPVLSETSDTAAGALASDYVSGTIVINPLPSLRITQSGQNVTLAWPLSATNYVLQEADSASASAAAWKDVTVAPSITDTDKIVSLPTKGVAKFYRLHRL